ncbi:glycoside hydrolase, partial [Cutaneotrichosporon oleaginosum]
MLLLRSGDEYVCVLPVSSDTALANLSRAANGLVINVRGASRSQHGRAAVVSTRTHDPRYISALCAAAVAEARKWLMGADVKYRPSSPSPLDGVGFCTWNALHEGSADAGRNVDESGIRHLVDTLVSSRLPIQTFVIDDGWHDRRHFRDRSSEADRRRGLWSFGAKPEIGEGGMKGIVTMVKDKLGRVKGVRKVEVGAWLALTGGYWDGVHPESPLVERYECKKYPASRQWWLGCAEDPLEPNHIPHGESFYVLPPPERAAEFWGDWFTQLRDAGISFLKVDNQAGVTSLDGIDGVHEALYLWETMYAAAERIFGPGRVIHCMSHSEATWAGPQGLGLTTRGQRFVWRNSDDFGLTGRSRSAHQQHFFTNLMNALLSNEQCTVPDADMFMLGQQHPDTHALLRALFPGPLLFSDPPGDPALLEWHALQQRTLLSRLTAKDKGGIARVLRAQRAAAPLSRRVLDTNILDYEDGTGQWAAAPVGPHVILGCWNVRGGYDRPCSVFDDLTVEDVEDAIGGDIDAHYIIVRMGVHGGGFLGTTVLSPGDRGVVCRIDSLSMLDAASFWIMRTVPLAIGPVAVLGLINTMAGPAALDGFTADSDSVTVRVKYAGVVGIVLKSRHMPKAWALIDDSPQVETVGIT